MTIRHLTIFVAVADQSSMSAAAASLYLSQPTVSQAIRELEKHYNGLLFERLGKKLYLTERGRLLRAELDVGIVEGEILSPDLTVLPIIDDCLILAVGKYHPFYHRNCIQVRDLAGETFTMRERGSGTRQ